MIRNDTITRCLSIVMGWCLVVWLGLYVPSVAMAAGFPSGATSVADTPTVGDFIAQACQLIYQGEFENSSRLINTIAPNTPAEQHIEQLRDIIDQYTLIEKARRQGRERAYQKQCKRLDTLRHSTIAEDIGDTNDTESADDPNDPNAVHTVSEVLSVIAAVCEFADTHQKKELLADDFVKQTIQRSLDQAARFETEGQWLEAFTTCYGWLKNIDPNNKDYEDYAEQVWEKTTIAASFEDSPCETQEQRYYGINKDIFVRAVHILDSYYVNKIDYSQMALEALQRLRSLTEVLTALSRKDETKESVLFFNPEAKQELAAWSQAVEGLLDEVKQASMGLTQTDFLQIYDRIFILNNATLKIPEPVLVVHMAQSALQSLDPHTTIIWPNQISTFEKDMTGEFSGIGIEIIKPQGKLTVASLLPDTPAYRAGLDAGDVITKIDGVPTRDMSLHCAVKRITGAKGTPVRLTIQREGAEGVMDLTIVRDTIDVPMIRGWQRTTSGQWQYIIDPQSRIAHVRIMSFSSPRVASDFDRVLKNLEKDGLNGLILDLRSNMGGHLDKAVSLVDMFVKQGMIVQTKPGLGYTRVPTTEWAHRRGTHPDYPLVILINSVSASASEIVAGALADPKHERAILVGERTHGKGSVQSIFSRGLYGAELKCTMAYYHLPSGQRVNTRDAMEKQGSRDWGVAPDIQLVLRSDEARALWDIQKENDVLVQANNSHQKQSKKHSIEDLLEVDHQLAVGLLLVKAKLIEKSGPLLATN